MIVCFSSNDEGLTCPSLGALYFFLIWRRSGASVCPGTAACVPSLRGWMWQAFPLLPGVTGLTFSTTAC